MDCVLCKILNEDIAYDGLIKRYKYWGVMISREQHTLGTMVIFLNRHLVRFSKIQEGELVQLQIIQRELESALDQLFQPDLYNYLQCGNSVEHLHIHMVPRYKKEKTFNNISYIDKKYGDSVAETTEIESEDTIVKLRGLIKKLF